MGPKLAQTEWPRTPSADLDLMHPEGTQPTIAGIFGPGGALEKCMPDGYEHRPSQLEMAELVDAAFTEKRHLIVEAGTGTGKTLAYLIPAIRSGRRVVISTATKSLQEQLFEKDIPFLQKYFAPKLKVAVMKGRGNFLCREKVYRMADQPMLKGLDELDWFQQIRDWEKVTETGDRAELNFLHDDSDLWQRLDARRDACPAPPAPAHCRRKANLRARPESRWWRDRSGIQGRLARSYKATSAIAALSPPCTSVPPRPI